MDGIGTNSASAHPTDAYAQPSEREISISPSFEHLDAVRTAVRDILDGADADTDALYLVAVTEVVTNAIEEHRRLESDADIAITVDSDRRVVNVIDSGRGYDPADRDARRQVEHGGWGLDLAEAGAPDLTWSHNAAGGTTFTVPHPTP